MLKQFRKRIFRQYDLGQYVGGLKDLLQRSLFYVNAINFLLLIITTYSVSKFVGQLSFPWFVGILGGMLLLLMVVEYKFILPSTWSFINRQRYQHGEPLKTDFKEVIDRLDRIEKALGVERSGNDSRDETNLPDKP